MEQYRQNFSQWISIKRIIVTEGTRQIQRRSIIRLLYDISQLALLEFVPYIEKLILINAMHPISNF